MQIEEEEASEKEPWHHLAEGGLSIGNYGASLSVCGATLHRHGNHMLVRLSIVATERWPLPRWPDGKKSIW